MAGIQKWHVLSAGSWLLITVQRELDTERLDLIFYVLFCFVLQTAIDQFCPSFLKKEESKCTAQRYRQYNGLCNNLEHPYWGAALTAFRRMIPADYADGILARLSSLPPFLPATHPV